MPNTERTLLTYSLLRAFRDCRRLARYTYIDQIGPIEDDREALRYGSLWHACQEVWHATRDLPSTLARIDALTPDESNREQHRARMVARATATAYASTYATETWTREQAVIEQTFRQPLLHPTRNTPHPRYDIGGRKDQVVVDIEGKRWILERKSLSRLDAAYLDALWMSPQAVIYLDAEQRSSGQHVEGVIYDLALKPQLQQTTEDESEEAYAIRYAEACKANKSGKSSAKRKLAEPDDEFAARLAAWFAEAPRFHRETIIVGPKEIAEARAELWDLAAQYTLAKRENGWYRNPSMCFDWGRPCPFLALCRSQESPIVRENLYTSRPAHSELAETPKPIY